MARKKQETKRYTVINGCNAGDNNVRYNIGDPYFAEDHAPEVTATLLEMECLEEVTGEDSE